MLIRIRIHRDLMTKNVKILRLKTRFIFIINKKLFFTVIPRALWSTTKLQVKPPAPKREHSTHPNNTFLHFFLFLWIIFAHQDPKKDPYSKCWSGYGSSRSKWKLIQTRYTAFCHLHWKNATFINSIEQAKNLSIRTIFLTVLGIKTVNDYSLPINILKSYWQCKLGSTSFTVLDSARGAGGKIRKTTETNKRWQSLN